MLLVYILAAIIVLFFLLTVIVICSTPFGAAATGTRLQRIQQSPNYRNGAFQNQEETPQLTEGMTMGKAARKFFFTRNPNKMPPAPLPFVQTDLKALDPGENLLIWFGHSSYLLQSEGRRFLIDPVLSGHASPFSFSTNAMPGSDHYKPADFPSIDYLVLTHDHWDHLDYKALLALKDRIATIITGLGTAAHLLRWGFASEQIIELDWNEEQDLGNGFHIAAAPARHFSGRGFKRNAAIWTAFVLQTPARKIFLGGDSGYGAHFKKIGEKCGPFDLAILECGQYNEGWKYIHMMPEEVVHAALDLGARALLPVHWGKFALSLHNWDEPIRRCAAEAKRLGLPLLHPMIGQVLQLNAPGAQKEWWTDVHG